MPVHAWFTWPSTRSPSDGCQRQFHDIWSRPRPAVPSILYALSVHISTVSCPFLNTKPIRLYVSKRATTFTTYW
jgi:hypothetical protein